MTDSMQFSYLFLRQYKHSATNINLFLRERIERCKGLYRKDLKAHYGCVNAIEFSYNGGEWLCSGGDDKRVLLWNVEKTLSYSYGNPVSMKGEHHSNIFTLAFDHENKKIFSGGNDEQVVVHDINTGESLDVFLHNDAVYGLSVDSMNDDLFVSAGEDGRILLYDLRQSNNDPFCVANYMSAMHSVMFNPVEPKLIVTANAKEGIGLWDLRKPGSCVLRYGGLEQQSAMSVRFNQFGDQIIALRRRLPPVLYAVHSAQEMFEFDHHGYYNSCTMKSCCFAGDKDQYLLSGSDDFNLYMWQIPENTDDYSKSTLVEKAHLVLRGHRSIVNQVRFNSSNHLIVSSGVEKVIKAWSPFPMFDCVSGITDTNEDGERRVYSHEEYLSLVLQNGHVMEHDYSLESTEEDPRMMAFFDSLVQRELEEWDTDSLSSDSDNFYDHYVESITDSDDNLSASEADLLITRFTSSSSNHPQQESSDQQHRSPADAQHNVSLNTQEARNISDNQNNIQQSNNEEAGVSNLESVQQNTISSLIERKRKEYLTQLKCKDLPNEKLSKCKSKSSKMVVLSRNVSIASDSSSDSDSNDDSKNLPLPPLLQISKRSNLATLCRLKVLRNTCNILDEDEPQPGTSQSYDESKLSCEGKSGSEMGNLIYNSVHHKQGKQLNESMTLHEDNSHELLATDLDLASDHYRKNNTSPSENKQILLGSVSVGKSDGPSSSSDSVNVNNCTVSKQANSEEECDNNHSSSNNPAQGEISWNEFKRFKNRLERARRKYHRKSQQDSSTEEND